MSLFLYNSRLDRFEILKIGLELGLGFGLGLQIINVDLSIDLFGVNLNNKLQVLELSLWIDPLKIEEVKKNLLLFKLKLCISIFIDICFKFISEKKLLFLLI